MLENNAPIIEPYTLEQPEEEDETKTREGDNDQFDIVDHANLVDEEMVENLENNNKKIDSEIDVNNAKLIIDKNHPEVEKDQVYKDKETLKNVLSYYAIKNNF
uniref:Uncharacterized protein n=1 Tax=Cannabis sativa TaxID=3483 RepID=A0A803PMD1_CANSA